MKKIVALTAVALLATTGTAHANNFAGPRVEVQLGLDAMQSKNTLSFTDQYYDLDDEKVVTEKYGPYNNRVSSTGLLYGAGIGYDFAVTANTIFGIEANLNFSNAEQGRIVDPETDDEIEDYYGGATYIPTAEDTYVTRIKPGREFDISLRAGYVVSPSTLLYVKAGYVNTRLKFDALQSIYDEDEDEFNYKNVEFARNRGGYRLGAGIETLLGGNAFVKAEYRYSQSKNLKFTVETDYSDGPDGDVTVVDTSNAKFGTDRHQALLGIGIRF